MGTSGEAGRRNDGGREGGSGPQNSGTPEKAV